MSAEQNFHSPPDPFQQAVILFGRAMVVRLLLPRAIGWQN